MHVMDGTAFIKGMGLSGGLIIALGAQNTFVLRQGLQRQYVLTCVLICILCDALLIAIGVAGMGTLIAANPSLLTAAKWIGAAFLTGYGARAAYAAWRPATLATSDLHTPPSHAAIIATAFAFSLLNPHVYLDTVVLLGSMGGQEPGHGRTLFAAGAMLASAIWFVSLGLGARFAAPLFAKTSAWRVLDGSIALIMWALAVSLFW
jgi:L-lysine exporter family protein LysE/ArgO